MIQHSGLNQEHEQFRERVRSFCEEEVRPVVQEHEEEGQFPVELVNTIGEAGLYGITVPEEYGGEGMDYRSFEIAIEEFARVWKNPSRGALRRVFIDRNVACRVRK